jgi:hypothetical protein
VSDETYQAPAPTIVEQLEQHLRDYHQRNREVDARFQGIDVKHADLHRYVGSLVDFENKLDRKLERTTRATEGLAISFGKQLSAIDDVKLEMRLVKTVLGKIAKKLGV